MKYDDTPTALLLIAICCAFAAFITWIVTQQTIATECRQLGGFYVGKAVFECKEKR